MARKSLARGLSYLASKSSEDEIAYLPLDSIQPNTSQPRRHFDLEALEELANSIRLHGLLQPIAVRTDGKDRYELIAGERRFRAGKLAGLSVIPAIVRSADDRESIELALVENLQREDITVVEAAQAYCALISDHRMTQEAIAARVGKSRPAIANAIRILSLPEPILNDVASGRLSEGHARALLSLQTPSEQMAVWRRIQADGLSVRDVERLSHDHPLGKVNREANELAQTMLSERLSRHLGLPSKVVRSGKRGRMTIEFYDEDDLVRLFGLLGFVG